jgi:hypothetical protein
MMGSQAHESSSAGGDKIVEICNYKYQRGDEILAMKFEVRSWKDEVVVWG